MPRGRFAVVRWAGPGVPEGLSSGPLTSALTGTRNHVRNHVRSICPRFGPSHVLGHTVQVALSQVRLAGHKTSAQTGASGPTLGARLNIGRGQGCMRATCPTAGAGGPRQVNSGAVSGATLDRPDKGPVDRRAGGT